MTGPRAVPRPPAWSMVVASMLLVQLSSALSVGLIGQVGAAGTAVLRLGFGAIVFVLVRRPPLRRLRRRDRT